MSDEGDPTARRPYQRHRFVVDAEGLPELGFTRVRGLEVAVEGGEAPERERRETSPAAGARTGWWNRRGGLLNRVVGGVSSDRERETTSPNLELYRGVTDDQTLWTWLRDWVRGRVEPRRVGVYLLDDAGEAAVGWVCPSATPVAWTGPSLRADDPGVAMERLELAHDGLRATDGPADAGSNGRDAAHGPERGPLDRRP